MTQTLNQWSSTSNTENLPMFMGSCHDEGLLKQRKTLVQTKRKINEKEKLKLRKKKMVKYVQSQT